MKSLANKTSAIELALIENDLSKLTPEERLSFYNSVCQSVGLNPLTQPLAYIRLNGKLTLYAKKDATDQLRKLHGVSITKLEKSTDDGICTVTAYAKDKTGKEDSDLGAVVTAGLRGDALANAYMKCTTKAKRRVTLSICGLGLLDESELDTIPASAKEEVKDVTPGPAGKLSQAMTEEKKAVEEDPGKFVMNFGKRKGMTLEEWEKTEGIDSLKGFLKWVEDGIAKSQKTPEYVKPFLKVIDKFLQSRSESSQDLSDDPPLFDEEEGFNN